MFSLKPYFLYEKAGLVKNPAFILRRLVLYLISLS